MVLHFAILYIPLLSSLFSIVPLSGEEWMAVVVISLPIILIDEVLKLASRIRTRLAEGRVETIKGKALPAAKKQN